MEEFEVTFSLSERDFRDFDRYLSKGRQWLFLAIPAAVGIPNLVVLVSNRFSSISEPQSGGKVLEGLGLTLLFPLGVIFLFWFFFIRTNYSNLRKKSPELFEKRVVAITPDHLVSRDSNGETRTFWSVVNKIDQDENLIYMMLSNQSGFIIPRRSFRDAAESELFYRTAKQYWKPNHGNPW